MDERRFRAQLSGMLAWFVIAGAFADTPCVPPTHQDCAKIAAQATATEAQVSACVQAARAGACMAEAPAYPTRDGPREVEGAPTKGASFCWKRDDAGPPVCDDAATACRRGDLYACAEAGELELKRGEATEAARLLRAGCDLGSSSCCERLACQVRVRSLFESFHDRFAPYEFDRTLDRRWSPTHGVSGEIQGQLRANLGNATIPSFRDLNLEEIDGVKGEVATGRRVLVPAGARVKPEVVTVEEFRRTCARYQDARYGGRLDPDGLTLLYVREFTDGSNRFAGCAVERVDDPAERALLLPT